MKHTIDVGIGGLTFTLEEDADARLENYLKEFDNRLSGDQKKEIMDDLENRIADILNQKAGKPGQVVTLVMVDDIINELGMPDGSKPQNQTTENNKEDKEMKPTPRKLYRNPDDKKIAGVCSGIAAFFNIDVALIRIIMLVALFCASTGFWIYLAIWIVAPLAVTPAQKCQMYGMPVTAENMASFTNSEK